MFRAVTNADSNSSVCNGVNHFTHVASPPQSKMPPPDEQSSFRPFPAALTGRSVGRSEKVVERFFIVNVILHPLQSQTMKPTTEPFETAQFAFEQSGRGVICAPFCFTAYLSLVWSGVGFLHRGRE